MGAATVALVDDDEVEEAPRELLVEPGAQDSARIDPLHSFNRATEATYSLLPIAVGWDELRPGVL